MRLKSCKFHNMGPFGDFTLDLEALGADAKLVALVGRNGTGKSFTIESAIAGAAYRKMPTNGALVKRATARDSWLESRLHYGSDWTIRHVIDAVSGKSEAVVTGEDGQPVLADTKVSTFDTWAVRHLPDADVLFSSVFAAQQSEGFVKMTSAERIDVVLSVTGVSRLERMAKMARDRKARAESDLVALVARIAEARGDTPAADAAESALVEALETAELRDEQHAAARLVVSDTESAARAAADLRRDYDARELRRAELQAGIAEATRKGADLTARIANNRAVQEQGDSIRSARAELDALAKGDAELATELVAVAKPFDEAAEALARELAAQQQVVTLAEAEVRAAQAKVDAAQAAVAAAGGRVTRAKARLADEDQVRLAATAAASARDRVTQARVELEAVERDLAEQRATTLVGTETRLRTALGGVELIRDLDGARVDEGPVMAGKVLANDAETAALAVDVPNRISDLEGKLSRQRAALQTLEAELAAAEKQAARADEMAAARLELANASTEEAAAVKDRALLDERLTGVTDTLSEQLATRRAITERQRAAEVRRAELEGPARLAITAKQQANAARRAELEPVAAKYDRLVAADARLAELEPQLVAAAAELARLVDTNSATPALPLPSEAPDVATCKRDLEAAESAARAAHGAVAVARQRVTDAKAVDGRLAMLERERVTLEADLADWARLAIDLGRSGLQSAEVDSAGPELTELVNDLLHRCHGPRFTVSVDTQRLDSTGHKMLDECRIQVIDTVMGTEKEIREHSGGERALLGTAVSLALTMLACRRAGFDRPTIVRDESGANLDVDSAPAWIRMLRRAVEVTGADRLVFVDHRPEIIAMADAVIEIPSFRKAAAA